MFGSTALPGQDAGVCDSGSALGFCVFVFEMGSPRRPAWNPHMLRLQAHWPGSTASSPVRAGSDRKMTAAIKDRLVCAADTSLINSIFIGADKAALWLLPA